MDISVIIPTFKPQDYIYTCLDSLVRQTLDKRKWEIILVINGIKEPYYSDICQKYAAILSNLKIFYCDTANVSVARNIGLDNSAGEFLTFIDDDDFVSEGYLDEMLKSMKNNHADIIISNAEAFNDSDSKTKLQYRLSKLFYKLLNRPNITIFAARSFFNGPCMKLINRDVICDVCFDKTFRNNEDALFMYQISSRINQINLAEPHAIYFRRFRANSAVTSTKKISYIFCIQIRFIYKVLKIYISNPTKYNVLFTTSRLFAGTKSMIIQIFRGILR